MTGREYMETIRKVKREIRMIMDDIERETVLAAGVKAIRYDVDKVQTSPAGDRMAAIIARITEDTDRLNERISYLLDLEETARRILVNLRDESARVLELHYLDGLSWVAISERMGYSDKHVFKLYDRALQEFDEILNG